MKKTQKLQVTPLSNRKLKGKLLRSPLAELADAAPLFFSSWVDEYLPNSLWMSIVASGVEQGTYTDLFSRVAARFGERFFEQTILPTHNFLSSLSDEEFDYVMEPILSNESIAKDLSALTLVESLPDHRKWVSLLARFPVAQPRPDVIVRAIAACINHQSQISTDIRWFKVISLVAVNKLRMPEDRLAMLERYPNPPEYMISRPFIRAIELSLRNIEGGSEKPADIEGPRAKEFWHEMLAKSACITSVHENQSDGGHDGLLEHLQGMKEELGRHFFESIEGTAIDPKLDAAFGLCLFSLSIAIEVAKSPSSVSILSKMGLRSVVESFITLRYLVAKDDPAVWMQYRNYGSGQTALTFLKNSVGDNPPEFLDMERLESLANEDSWLETRDIAIGNWANLNLRRMSEETGVKSVYDAFYDWSSGFVHGHWGVVRDTCFVTCLNPLHRLHRVPSEVPIPSPVMADMCKLINRALDELCSVYPGFKLRIKWKDYCRKK